jgi:type IV pilus assembly protein PilA
MKPEVTLKYLSYVANKKNKGQEGFTLIELLVVVIIIGVLAAVALPNLLGQVGKARETELKNAVGTVNRSQQAYHFERQSFADSVTLLGIVIPAEYITDTTMSVASGADSASNISTNTNSATDGTRAFGGFIDHAGGQYSQVLCITDAIADAGVVPTDGSTCATGSVQVR